MLRCPNGLSRLTVVMLRLPQLKGETAVPIHSPPDSSAASLIQAFAWIIPLLAVGLLLLAAPTFRAAMAKMFVRSREYFYGPDDTTPGRPDASEASEEDSDKKTAQSSFHDNLKTFDRSFYAEDEDET